jgi:hypothetical protein
MVTGIATLGILSGTMASFFRPSASTDATPPADEEPPATDPVAGELAALREQLSAIEAHLGSLNSERGGSTE